MRNVSRAGGPAAANGFGNECVALLAEALRPISIALKSVQFCSCCIRRHWRAWCSPWGMQNGRLPPRRREGFL